MSFNVLYNSSNDGVAPGGLRDRDKIKVLICYLVDKTDNGTGKDFICGVLQKCGAANYFEASQGFDELTANGQLEADEQTGFLRPSGTKLLKNTDRLCVSVI